LTGADGGFDTAAGATLTLSGNISGAGALGKIGAGTLILTGTNSYTGGTIVAAGILQGNILNNAAVVFNQTMTDTYAGNMSGTGSLTLQGGGVLNVTANNTYTGPTSVMAGMLAVNGSLTRNVTVGFQGTLGGNGLISGSMVNAGTLTPGNSIGTLNVSGTYTLMTGSSYQVEVNGSGQGDRSTSPARRARRRSRAARCRCWPRRQRRVPHPGAHLVQRHHAQP
jgi:fibronectin-binding autotransporter adhesin